MPETYGIYYVCLCVRQVCSQIEVFRSYSGHTPRQLTLSELEAVQQPSGYANR